MLLFVLNALLCIFRMPFSSEWLSRLSVTSAEMHCERTQASLSPAARCSQWLLHSPSHSSFLIRGRSKQSRSFDGQLKQFLSYLVCFVCLFSAGWEQDDPETFEQTPSRAVPNSLTQKWMVPACAASSVFLRCSPSGPGRRWNLLSLCSSSSSTCTFTKHKPSRMKLLSMI